ncbi:hypothetical protein [Paramagnetospirillum magneticum]|nr:hypothetical protein [Paramagnetospirillum magneticum]
MFRFTFARSLLVVSAACALLAACGGEPSESDMKSAVEQTFGGMNEQLGGVGKLIGKDLSTKVKSFKKLACAEAKGNPGFACDFQMVVDGPLGEKTEKASARFVKGDKGWAVF